MSLRASTAALSIWKTLTPGVDLTLSVHLHSDDDDQANVVALVSLRRGSRALASQTINGKLLRVDGGAVNLRDVATVIAAWVWMSLSASLSQPERLYGATQWPSVAAGAVAARRDLASDSARRLYELAVSSDSDNMAARFGLVGVLLTTGGLAEQRTALAELELLAPEHGPPPGWFHLPLGWRARYSRAAALGDLAHART